jgi:WD40 repeat protein
MEVIEVPSIQGMVASSIDKKLVVWDLKTNECRFVVTLDKSFSIHTLKYSGYFDLMFTASYENHIKIWNFDSAIECTNISQLEGHDSMVTAIELINGTNYLVSSDELGCIKCWDLRTFKCLQTFRFDL